MKISKYIRGIRKPVKRVGTTYIYYIIMKKTKILLSFMIVVFATTSAFVTVSNEKDSSTADFQLSYIDMYVKDAYGQCYYLDSDFFNCNTTPSGTLCTIPLENDPNVPLYNENCEPLYRPF